MAPAKTAAVAMSGGVDSSVTAALLKSRGYEVFGLTMKLSDTSQAPERAAEIAQRLGIPHHVIDLRPQLRETIIQPFCAEYERGRTPNPCVECNRRIKFGLLLESARSLGADFLATGHYARIEPDGGGFRLHKGVDPAKDQSYFLYTLGQAQLERILMPLGGMHKSQTKQIAKEMGLADLIHGESQDLCFIPEDGLEPFIAGHTRSAPGDIVGTGGEIIGRHTGLVHYTIGQRHGLGLASDKPLYVIRLDAEKNQVVAGNLEQLFSRSMAIGSLTWISGEAPPAEIEMTIRVRYRSPGATGRLYLFDDYAEVIFDKPQRAIAPGQSAVFYVGDIVLGGGIIERVGEPGE